MSLRGAGAPAETLGEDLHDRLGDSVVVMGIGNQDRGDDGAGPRVTELLAEALPDGALPGGRHVTILMAGEVPESFVGRAADAHPDVVLLVDAAGMGAAPGSVALLEAEDLTGGAAFTHRTPLSLLATFLRHETGADVFLLAVQPRSVEWGEPLSSEVEAAAQHLARILAAALRSEAAAC